MIRRRLTFVPGNLRAFAVHLGLILLLAGCGGGPTVATSTGRILYVATQNGIYGFSIMSDSTLKPLSSQALESGSFQQIAVTPGIPSGESSLLLLATSGGATLSAWTIGGTGTLTQTTAPTTTSCTSYSGSITGVAITHDSKYIFVVDGTNNNTTNNAATIAFSGGGCSTSKLTTSNAYPIQPALDCQVAGSSSNCILLLTLSTAKTSGTITPMAPEEDTFTESTGALTATSYTPFKSCSSCPQGVSFNSNTLYFYAIFNGGNPSLQSIAPEASSSTSTVSFSSASLNLPCVDSIGGNAYVPTTNGYLYSVGTGTGGSLGSVTTLLTPSTFGTTLTMTSCAVVTNP